MRSKKSFLLFRNRQSAFFSVVVVAASLSSQSVVEGQGLFSGFGICACTPSVYDFQLDVSLECPISEALDLILEEGIESAECAIVPADSGDIEDTLPVSIHSINIEELRQDKTVAVSQSIQGDFRDGDAFRYISLSSDLEDIRGAVDLPKTLQFKISGKNVDGDEIYNTVVIEFTNDCDAYPVIQAGHTAGWIRFLETLPPDAEICSAFSPPPSSPSFIPSDLPSFKPSSHPSTQQTESPTEIPSDLPSLMPSSHPSTQQTESPTEIPSDLPSLMPSSHPSTQQTESPTEIQVDAVLMDTMCSICSQPDQCIQSPGDLYPNLNNTAMQVTCGQVEQFALFSNALSVLECSMLKSNSDNGFCGGCGTSNCILREGFSYAAPPVTTASPSRVPSASPSETPTTSFPTSFPTVPPTTAVPSVAPSGVPSQVPSIIVPEPTPTVVNNTGPLSPLYDIPREWTPDTEELISCALCSEGGCSQKPDEIFPHTEEDVEVSCGTVEEFAFTSGISRSYCTLLKTYLFWGSCGGCGTENCS